MAGVTATTTRSQRTLAWKQSTTMWQNVEIFQCLPFRTRLSFIFQIYSPHLSLCLFSRNNKSKNCLKWYTLGLFKSLGKNRMETSKNCSPCCAKKMFHSVIPCLAILALVPNTQLLRHYIALIRNWAHNNIRRKRMPTPLWEFNFAMVYQTPISVCWPWKPPLLYEPFYDFH